MKTHSAKKAIDHYHSGISVYRKGLPLKKRIFLKERSFNTFYLCKKILTECGDGNYESHD